MFANACFPGSRGLHLALGSLWLLWAGCTEPVKQPTAPPKKQAPPQKTAPRVAAPLPAQKKKGTVPPRAQVDPREIIKRSKKGVFLIAYRVPVATSRLIKEGTKIKPESQKGATTPRPRARPKKMGPWILLCTAFAHGKRTLATTGDCVHFVEMALKKKVDYFIAQNLGLSRSFRVVKTFQHSGYCRNKQGLNYDLGALEVDRDLGVQLPVASADELQSIQEKDAVYYYGFPAEATPDLKAPTASMIAGKVARLTDVEYFEKAPYANRVIIHHDALSSEGTSGSPIFAASGNIIGVQAGSHHFPLDLTAVARTSKRTRKFSFGIRIDQMSKVLRE